MKDFRILQFLMGATRGASCVYKKYNDQAKEEVLEYKQKGYIKVLEEDDEQYTFMFTKKGINYIKEQDNEN